MFWDFLMAEQILLSPQVKRSRIISNGLPNDLRLRIFGNQKISGNSQNFIKLLPSAQSSSRNKNFVSASKNVLKNRNWTFLVVCYFRWRLEFLSNILWMTVDFLKSSASIKGGQGHQMSETISTFQDLLCFVVLVWTQTI